MRELLEYRTEFPILEHTTYLINHSLAAMPRRAEERLAEYARMWRERGIRSWGEGWWTTPMTVGDQVGRIVGAPAGSTVMHQNVAIAEAVVLSCFFPVDPARNRVVYERGNFPSVRYLYQAQPGLEVIVCEDDGAIADAMPTELTQGQRKLVGVARAIAMRPRLLCLDEPAAGLDTRESEDLGQRLRQIADSGTTTLLIDHDMGLVLNICDRIVVLEFGQVIAAGPPDEVRRDARVVKAYLGGGAAKQEVEAVTARLLPEPKGEIIAVDVADAATRAEIEKRKAEIDLTSTQSIIRFGSAAQGELQAISQEMLSGVHNKDVGPAGASLRDMVTSLRGFSVRELDPNRKLSW